MTVVYFDGLPCKYLIKSILATPYTQERLMSVLQSSMGTVREDRHFRWAIVQYVVVIVGGLEMPSFLSPSMGTVREDLCFRWAIVQYVVVIVGGLEMPSFLSPSRGIMGEDMCFGWAIVPPRCHACRWAGKAVHS